MTLKRWPIAWAAAAAAAWLAAARLPAESVAGSAPAAPRSEAALFRSIGTPDGLPNSSVSGIVQDRQGFIWFGTQGGLARYDGISFKRYGVVPFDRESLSHDLVQTVYLDESAIWAGTYGGLSRLDPATERFSSYRHDPADPSSLSNPVVTCIARDAAGRLWAGTLSGLNRLDEATGAFARYMNVPGDAASLPANNVRALTVDRKGRLWVGTSGGGLARYAPESDSFVAFRGSGGGALLSDFVMSIDEDEAGALWIGTWYGGLSCLDPDTGKCVNYRLGDDRVYVVEADVPGTVYAGTWGGGLFALDVESGAVARYRSGQAPGSLPHDVIYSLLYDRAGELWVGTNGGGAAKLGRSWRSYEAVYASAGGMPAGKVYASLVDRRGSLWVGVYSSGIARRDSPDGPWRRYVRDPADPASLPNDIVNFLFEDSGGSIWAGTNDGLARYDPRSDSFRTMRPRSGDPGSLSSEVMYAMAESRDCLWVGTFRSGLDRVDKATGAVSHFSNDPSDPASLSDNMVTALEFDAAGALWVGTNKGLNRLTDRGFARYLYDPSDKTGISADSVKTLFRDSEGRLWIGTFGGGLVRYEPETDSFVSFGVEDGLPSATVVRILEDGSGRLWIATQLGLVVYDVASGVFRTLAVHGGTLGREFFQGACRTPDGALCFGAMDVLFRFYPELYEFNDSRPPVVLTEITVAGRPGPLAGASRAKSLVLGWREKSFALEFAALDYRDSARNLYSWRLEGFDEDWSAPSRLRRVSYTHLPPGSYVFKARASNNDGLWNEDGLRLDLRVEPSPWLHPLAVLAYAAAIAGAGFLLHSRLAEASMRPLRAERDALRRELEKAEERARLSVRDEG